jgi:hypothetical protein
MLNETTILRDNIKGFRLLTEWVSRNDVEDAIKNRDIIYIYYSGDKTVNRGFRTIEPYALGTSKPKTEKNSQAGNLVLRAYQQSGESDRGENPQRPADHIPGWRLFRLDGITEFIKTMKQFPAEGEDLRDKYNPNDKDMINITASVDLNYKNDVDVDGMGSISDPTIHKQRGASKFDIQSNKFKSFFDVNKDVALDRKEDILNLYDKVKKQKKNPSNYSVINKDGKISIINKDSENKYDDSEIMGNLDKLFRKSNNPKTFKIDEPFIEKQRRLFDKNREKRANV